MITTETRYSKSVQIREVVSTKNGSLGYKPRTGKYLSCLVCDKKYYVKPYSSIRSKYCSNKCKAKSQENKKTKKCSVCKKDILRPESTFRWSEIRGSKHSICSKECGIIQRSISRKGLVRSPLWSMRNADKLFSDYIRQRDNWTCRICGGKFEEKDINLHNSHYYGRSKMSTRFDQDNCVALCFKCHQRVEKNKKGEYKEYMVQWLGEERLQLLEDKSKMLVNEKQAIENIMQFFRSIKK